MKYDEAKVTTMLVLIKYEKSILIIICNKFWRPV